MIKKINSSLKILLKDIHKRYHLNLVSDTLFKHMQEFVLRKGKRVRPLLFILAYTGYSQRSRINEEKLYSSSVAIELLHDFMLIHDDVIDNSDLRRGKPTLHRLFETKIKMEPTRANARGFFKAECPSGHNHPRLGRRDFRPRGINPKGTIGPKLAIIAGDILYAVAIKALLSIDEDPKRKEQALHQLVAAAAYTGAGEFLDVISSHRPLEKLTQKEIFLNYTLKTARYTFECPLIMGATLAGADQKEVKKLSSLALAAGQAFQLYDDFLDLFGTEKVIGKPILTDLNESKKTLLVFRAYQKLGKKQKKLLKILLTKKNKKRSDLECFRDLIVQSGSYQDCQATLVRLQRKATRLISELKIREKEKNILKNLITNISSSMPSFKIPS
jgi:geranylgeranyl diphosphate synthase type I